MASYQESAEKINSLLKDGLVEMVEGEDTEDKLITFKNGLNKFINGMLWFGAVAKFRCRNNSAYDNFAKLCLEGIVEIERTQLLGFEFETLRVKKERKEDGNEMSNE